MERTATAAGPAFGVAPGGDLERGGVRLDDRVEERIEPLDAAQVRLGQLDAAQPARNHQRLELGDRGLEPRSGLVRVDAWRQSVVDRHILAARESNDPGAGEHPGRDEDVDRDQALRRTKTDPGRLTTRVEITLVQAGRSRPTPRG